MMPEKPDKIKWIRPRWVRRTLRVCGVLLFLFICFIGWFYWVTKVNPPVVKETAVTLEKRTDIGPNRWKHGNSILQLNKYGIYEMYLEGNPYELGYSNGALTKELNEFQERAFVNQIKLMIPSNVILNKLKYFIAFFNRNLEENIPLEYREEIFGVSRFASDSFNFIAEKYQRMLNYHAAHDIGHALQDKNMTAGCTSFVIKGKKTSNGKLLMGRNFDFYSGDSFAKNKIVCFVNPQKGFKYAYVTWAGFTGVVSGMNEKGLCVTINAAKSSIPGSAKTPISLLVKEILQYAGNISDAQKIVQKRATFVSESLLVASAADKTAVIIEKSPDKLGVVNMVGDVLICSNHYQSATFKNDEKNLKNIKESSSEYRYNRMNELIGEKDGLSPNDVATILRNRLGSNDKKIGWGNEKCINQLICHHSVIFDPEQRVMYVSCNPFQLGTFVSYNLNEVFNAKLSTPLTYTDNIPADSFMFSKDFSNFVEFKKRLGILKTMKTFEEEMVEKTISLNPDYFLSYQATGDYCFRLNEYSRAQKLYEQALKMEIATEKEKQEIEEKLKKCKNKL